MSSFSPGSSFLSDFTSPSRRWSVPILHPGTSCAHTSERLSDLDRL